MNRRRGFSTVEMMLAVYLLAFGLATTAYMIPASTKGLGQSRLATQAAFFAQQRLEEAMVSPGADQVKVHPDVPELTGEIRRTPYSDKLTYAEAIVYRTGDRQRRPLVHLESLGTKGPSTP